jgi:hypothetical protein
MTQGKSRLSRVALWSAGIVCAGQFVAFGQISPCGSGQQLGNNTVITSGSPVYWSSSYVSAGSMSVNINGNTIAGSANVTIRAGTQICLVSVFKPPRRVMAEDSEPRSARPLRQAC